MHNHTRTHDPRRVRRALLDIGVLLIAGATAASAQGWQETIGSNNAVGETGVSAIETANGDMLAACFTMRFPYLIRTDAFGTIQWHLTYNINNYLGGRLAGVREYPNGDIGVVGMVADAAGTQRVLVMRLQSNGTPIWITTLGDASADMVGTGLVITTRGTGPAHPGDIAICGESRPLLGSPHGIMARLDGANGNLVWFKDYEVSVIGGISWGQLSGIDEAQIGTGSSPGDIVAVGNQVGVAGGVDVAYDIWVIRVNGNNGTAVGPGLGSAVFGTPQLDIGTAITELRYGANPGDLAITGLSDGGPNGSRDVVVLQTLPDPTDPGGPRASAFIGGGGTDAGHGICEITPGVGGTTGNLVIAGMTNGGSFGQYDAFIHEVQEGALTSVGPMHYMGGNGDDAVFSVSPVVNGPTSNGYIMAGYTESTNILPVGNTRNVYLLKNFYTTLGNNCQVSTLAVNDAPAGFTPTVNTIVETNQVTASSETAGTTTPPWGGNQLCNPDSKPMAPESDLTSVDGAVTITAHPSLVRRGDRFTLDYSLAAPSAVTTTISDVAGRIVSQTTLDRDAGEFGETIETGGWSAGTYLARVSVDGHMATSRIVVIDR